MRIGLVLNILDEEYQISIYKGITRRAKELGVEIICFQKENVPFSAESFIGRFPAADYFNLDGIILLTTVLTDSSSINYKSDLEKVWNNIPVISIGQKIQDVPSVMVQADSSMKELMEHLINHHKYRKFLYISGSQNHYDANRRQQIFEDYINKSKKKFPEMEYYIKNGAFAQRTAAQALKDFYEENPGKQLDVVVCASDNMAIGAYKFFQMNRDNPAVKSCAVTGFDDIPQARFVIPPVTTIRQPMDVLGVKAIENLVEMINGKEIERESYIDSNLIIRSSCGCNKKNDDWKTTPDFIQDIQTHYVQSEQMLRMVSHIGQDLNYAENEDGLKYVVNVNMDSLDIKDFCVLSFPHHNSENFMKDLNPITVKPLYVRRNGKFFYEFGSNKEMLIGDFYKKYLEFDENIPKALVFKFLYSGSDIIGGVLYDAADYILPYICSFSINIAQTMTKIEVLEERKRRSEYLEREVAKRTSELIEANDKRMKVEAEVLKISELERQRFSNDLHDDICQRLAGISMLCRSYSKQEAPVERKQMEELAQLIGDTLQTTRQYAHHSYPVELESLGMNHSIGNLCDSFSKQNGINCEYVWDISDDIEFDKTEKLNIFRIIQESLHNIMKHSKAKNVQVLLKSDADNQIVVKVCDDGCGISADKEKKTDGLGLNSMQYRANQIGATFKIYPAKPAGTCVEVKLKKD